MLSIVVLLRLLLVGLLVKLLTVSTNHKNLCNIFLKDCRERCGGMGYLEANRFGFAISGSHSSRTAEGDNSVLMNKVASEFAKKVDPKEIGKILFKGKFLSLTTSYANISIDQMLGVMENFKEQSYATLMYNMSKVSFYSKYFQLKIMV